MSRKLVATLTVALAVTSLAACGRDTAQSVAAQAPAPHEGGLISIIVNDPSNPYWKTEQDVAKARATALGYTTDVSASKGKAATEKVLVETAIQRKSVALVLDPADKVTSIATVQEARAAGIPVFLVNAQINADGIAQGQLYSDNAQGAQIGGKAFAAATHGTGDYVELKGAPSDINAGIRSNGFADVLKGLSGLHKVGTGTANWDRGQGQDQMVSLLKRHAHVTAVIAGNDEMAIGAVTALKQAGRFKGVVVGGFDGSPDAVAAVKAGDLQYTVLQPVAVFAQAAVDQADYYLKNGRPLSPTERQAFHCVLITKANADRYTAAFTLAS